eukprot:1376611-Amorphochlora_amoeboformis.AAC.1
MSAISPSFCPLEALFSYPGSPPSMPRRRERASGKLFLSLLLYLCGSSRWNLSSGGCIGSLRIHSASDSQLTPTHIIDCKRSGKPREDEIRGRVARTGNWRGEARVLSRYGLGEEYAAKMHVERRGRRARWVGMPPRNCRGSLVTMTADGSSKIYRYLI